MAKKFHEKLNDLSHDIDRVADILDPNHSPITMPNEGDIPDHLDGYIQQLWGAIKELQERINEAKSELAS